MPLPQNSLRFLWLLIAVAVALLLGYIHHSWFYPLFFHGDSAAMHVLGSAIYDETSLLPRDFYFGNQLVMLRSSPFIALATALGFSGYDSFAIGSAMSIAFWGGVLFYLLRMYVSSHALSFALLIALLIPIGPWDEDLLLGQQSHLSNAILALGLTLGAAKYVGSEQRSALVVATLCLLLMSVESPIRGLLVLVPLIGAVYLFAANWQFKRIIWVTGGVFVASFVMNKLLLGWRPIALNHFSSIRLSSTDEIIGNLSRTTLETIHSVTMISYFDGAKLTVGGLIVLGLGLLILGAYSLTIIYGLRAVFQGVTQKLYPEQTNKASLSGDVSQMLVISTAALGVVVGALAVATLNPDSSRHYLWAVFVLKFCMLKWLFDWLQSHTPPSIAIAVPLLLCFFASTWFGVLGRHFKDLDQILLAKSFPDHVQQIERISADRGINRIYGEDFWRMMPLNSLVQEMRAQPIVADGGELKPYTWLSRPSWSCPGEPVMFLLKDGPVDQIIESQLRERNAELVHEGSDYTIWIGPPLWEPGPRANC